MVKVNRCADPLKSLDNNKKHIQKKKNYIIPNRVTTKFLVQLRKLGIYKKVKNFY